MMQKQQDTKNAFNNLLQLLAGPGLDGARLDSNTLFSNQFDSYSPTEQEVLARINSKPYAPREGDAAKFNQLIQQKGGY